MLVGLAAKNAILIVDSPSSRREQGDRSSRRRSTARGSASADPDDVVCVHRRAAFRSRLRWARRRSAAGLGTAVVFGMLVATLVGVFLHPVFYVLLQRVSERQWPFTARDAPLDTRRHVASEAHRHARATAIAAHSD
jgi:HAE1 family hydrophobic/amphiphilic exporter-1/multidrug efflux pump